MKKIFFLTFLLSALLHAQFSKIEKYPYEVRCENYSNQIFDLGNAHLIMFSKNDIFSDSVYVSHSYNNGINWDEPKTIGSGNYITSSYVNGKIFLITMSRYKNIYVSNDNGESWEGPYSLPSPTGKIYFALFHTDKYYLFRRANPVVYFTSQNGTDWSEQNRFSFNIANFKDISFIKFTPSDYVVAFITEDTTDNRYKIKLARNTILNDNWDISDAIVTAKEGETIESIRAIENSDGKYWILYTKTNSELNGEKDIYYICSEDEGATWSAPQEFAHSYQDDKLASITVSSQAPIATFISFREYGYIFYGKPSISIDDDFPPYLKTLSHDVDLDYNINKTTFIAKVKAFGASTISKVDFRIGDTQLGNLYDDGNHNDGIAGDSIYAGTVTVNQTYGITLTIAVQDAKGNETKLDIEQLEHHEMLLDEGCIIVNGNASMPFFKNGKIADVYTIGTEQGCTNALFDNRPTIYGAGFALSGYSNGVLWSNGMMTSRRILDYIPGNVGDNGNGKFYYVKSSDEPFGESWTDWSEAVEHGAKFYDGNGDGIYNPVDLNGNGVWDYNEDAPDLHGNVTGWCVYNDGLPASERALSDVEPQGIEIRQTVWTDRTNPDLKNVFFIRYSIYNTGTVAETLDSVYFGVWNDDDVGNYLNDLVGSRKELLTGYTYDSGTDSDFGNNAPTVMQTFLSAVKTPVNDIPGIENLDASFHQGKEAAICYGVVEWDPTTKEEVRNDLLGLWVTGSIINPCDWWCGQVFNENCSTINGRWIYSGNPVDSTGWINTCPFDQRSMLNIGPFSINSGESVDITVAYHFSRGETNLQSVALGLAKAQYLINNKTVWDTTGVKEVPLEFSLSQNYPNPITKAANGNSVTTIEYTIPRINSATSENPLNVRMELYDILGRKVATIVNKKQIYGKYKVSFNANNLPSGVYFYRMIAGDFVQTKKMMLLK